MTIETKEGAELIRQLERLLLARAAAPPQGMMQLVMQPPTKGERGVWVVVTAALIQLVCTGFLTVGFCLMWIDNKDRGHQMNALYQSVPGLRELVTETMKENQKINSEEGQQQ